MGPPRSWWLYQGAHCTGPGDTRLLTSPHAALKMRIPPAAKVPAPCHPGLCSGATGSPHEGSKKHSFPTLSVFFPLSIILVHWVTLRRFFLLCLTKIFLAATWTVSYSPLFHPGGAGFGGQSLPAQHPGRLHLHIQVSLGMRVVSEAGRPGALTYLRGGGRDQEGRGKGEGTAGQGPWRWGRKETEKP